jgi:hypothetical protein
MRRWKKWMVWCLGAMVVMVLSVAGYFWYMYPEGYHPACGRALRGSLEIYAGDHDGKYPAGEATPEASLSLLYPDYCDAYILAGKTKSAKEAERILKAGGKLGPETCDWHYVEGLTQKEYYDMDMALFWDKSNLNHQGRRMLDGSHEVYRQGTFSPDYVPGSKWAEFLAEQKRLLEERASRKTGEVEKGD